MRRALENREADIEMTDCITDPQNSIPTIHDCAADHVPAK